MQAAVGDLSRLDLSVSPVRPPPTPVLPLRVDSGPKTRSREARGLPLSCYGDANPLNVHGNASLSDRNRLGL